MCWSGWRSACDPKYKPTNSKSNVKQCKSHGSLNWYLETGFWLSPDIDLKKGYFSSNEQLYWLKTNCEILFLFVLTLFLLRLFWINCIIIWFFWNVFCTRYNYWKLTMIWCTNYEPTNLLISKFNLQNWWFEDEQWLFIIIDENWGSN